jgi:hypothetical protein
MPASANWLVTAPATYDVDTLMGAPLSGRILDRLAFIMTTAEEVSVLVDAPGANEDEVRYLTDVLHAVYVRTDELMRQLTS